MKMEIIKNKIKKLNKKEIKQKTKSQYLIEMEVIKKTIIILEPITL